MVFSFLFFGGGGFDHDEDKYAVIKKSATLLSLVGERLPRMKARKKSRTLGNSMVKNESISKWLWDT